MLDQLHRPGTYVFGAFRLDPNRRALSYRGELIELRPTLFDVLLYLVEHNQQVVSKDDLLDAVWDGRSVEESNVSQTIFWLRAVLREHGRPDAAEMIQTARGRGYRFAEQVSWEHGELVTSSADGSAGAALAGERIAGSRGLAADTLTRPTVWRGWLWSLSLLAFIALVLGAYCIWRQRTEVGSKNKVVLADFENDTRDPAFDRSLATVLRADLAQSPFVDLVPDKLARDAVALMTKPADTVLTPALAQEVCVRTNSDAVLSGAIAALGTGYLITLSATDCSGRHEIAIEKAEAAGREAVVSALDRMIAKMRRRLGEPVASVDRFNVPLIPIRTGSLDALRAYSEGVWLNNHGQPEAATAPLRQAVSLDPQFASAYFNLGVAYNNLMQAALAQDAMRKGYELRGTLNARQKVKAEAYYDQLITGDYNAEIRALSLGTELYPRDASFWTDLANVDATLGSYEESALAAQRAVANNPQLETAYLALARADLALGRPAQARAVAMQAVKAGVAGAMIHAALLDAALMENDAGGMDRELDWAGKNAPDASFLQVEGEIRFRQGRIRDGTRIFEQLGALAKQQGQPDTSIPHRARLLNDLGLSEQARALLLDAKGADDDDDYIFTTASVGNREKARKLLAQQMRRYPDGTLIHSGFAPEIEAAMAMRRGKPADAIEALRPALPYQSRSFDTPYLLGRAYLAAGEGRQAEAAFRTVLTHEGWYPESVIFPLARLGLARALKLTGDRLGSEAAYRQFIEGWRGADVDAPALVAAKLELAAFQKPASGRTQRTS